MTVRQQQQLMMITLHLPTIHRSSEVRIHTSDGPGDKFSEIYDPTNLA